MTDATTKLFEEIDRRGYEPVLSKVSGTLRLDLHEGAHTTHWTVMIDRGKVRVSQEDREADAVVGTSPAIFEEIASGRENGVAALLRGDVTASGDMRLVLQFERVFPGNPNSRGPRRVFLREVH